MKAQYYKFKDITFENVSIADVKYSTDKFFQLQITTTIYIINLNFHFCLKFKLNQCISLVEILINCYPMNF